MAYSQCMKMRQCSIIARFLFSTSQKKKIETNFRDSAYFCKMNAKESLLNSGRTSGFLKLMETNKRGNTALC